MSQAQKIVLESRTGDKLYGLSWHVQDGIANVIIMEGMEEHSSRYDNFAQYLNKEGFNVYCIDVYGQGENVNSDFSNRGIWPKSAFRKQVQAVDTLVEKLRISCRPTFIFAHSMGSFMVQDFIQRYNKRPTKAVIMGTNGPNAKILFSMGYPLARLVAKLRGENRPAKFLAGMAVGAYSKAVKDRKTPLDWLSYNEENVQKYIADPKCGHGSSNGFYRELLKGNHRLYRKKFLAKINKDLPILVTAGVDDPVGAFGKGPTALVNLYHKLGIKNAELKLYDHMRHEILNEDEKLKVYNDILEFIKK